MKMYLILQADSSKFSRYQWTKFIWFLKIFKKRLCTSKTQTINQCNESPSTIRFYPILSIWWIETKQSGQCCWGELGWVNPYLLITQVWTGDKYGNESRSNLVFGFFFVDSSQTPQRQSSTTSSTAMRLQQFSSKTAKVPKAVFYSGLHYICLVKSVNFCVPSPQILFCVLLVIKTHALSFHLFKNGQKSWVKLNRNGEAWGDLQPNYSYFHKRTKLCTFPM